MDSHHQAAASRAAGGPAEAAPADGEPARRRLAGLAIGLAPFLAMLALAPPAGMEPAAWHTAAVAVLMAALWVSEALPIPITALLPLILFPLLGIARLEATAAPFANPLIFLFMGGFMIGLAMERWALHRRIALALLGRVGARPAGLIAGFLGTAAALSMWVSNTATAVMMLPIALSVIRLVAPPEREPADGPARGLAVALLLAVAYGASIGGLATLVGTPPNALLAGYMEANYGIEIGFAQWMIVGLPLSLAMLAAAFALLTALARQTPADAMQGAAAAIRAAAAEQGRWTAGEKRVAGLFAATALLWIFRPLLGAALPWLQLSDPAIAILGAVALFVIPENLREGRFLMNWEWARRLPWDVLLLFGGGLSLAAAVNETGLAGWIAGRLGGLAALPTILAVLLVTTLIIFLTEMTSNTATAATFLPLVGSLAVGFGAHPLLLAAPAAIAASCAFMLPVATPPNAIVFGSGRLRIVDMARTGLWLNLAGIALITLVPYTLLPLAFDLALVR